VDAGTYYVQAIALENGGYLQAKSDTITVTISKATIAKPSEYNHTFVYTGDTLTYHIPESEDYYVEGNQKVNAGEYTVLVILEDPNNNTWDDGKTNDLEYKFVINQATGSVSELKLKGWVYGDTPNSPSAYSNFGSINYSYAVKDDNATTSAGCTFTSIQPSDAGTYWVKASITGNDNYTSAEEVIEFVIERANAQLIWNNENNFLYNETDHYPSVEVYYLDVSGNKVSVSTQTQEMIEAGTYVIKALVSGPNYNFIDVTGTYVVSDVNNTLHDFDIKSWTVGQTPNAPEGYATFGQVVFTYASEYDGPYSSVVPTAAGSYYCKAYVAKTTSYSELLEIKQFFIYKHQVATPTIGTTTYTYTGKNIVFQIETSGYYKIIGNVKLNAGTYEVTITLLDKDNYIWEEFQNTDDLTYNFAIVSGKNTVSDLKLANWTYGENPNTPTATSTFGVVRFSYCTTEDGIYTSTIPSSAGTYYVKAYVRGNSNYDETSITAPFEILKATTTISDLAITSWEYGTNLTTLGATSNYGTIVYTYSTSLNGVYTKVIPTKVGTYYVKATVEASRNYTSCTTTTQFNITKAKVTKPVLDTTTYTYTGKNIVLGYNDEHFNYNAYYKMSNNVKLNVGSYTATVSLLDKENTMWADETSDDLTFDYEIIASTTNEIKSLSIEDWEQGDNPNEPEGTATFGVVQFLYASSEDGDYSDTAPSTAGTYYLKGYVKATTNYPACQQIITFTINPESNATEKKDNAITSLTIASWTYGDAASTPSITATYGAETVTYTYATSIDGTYSATPPKTAGTYYLKATIAEGNKYKAAEATTTFTINRKQIAKPEEDKTTYTYTGSLIVYQVADNDAYVIDDNGHTNVGTYDVIIYLKDKVNYEWEDGTTDNLTYKFVINKNPNDSTQASESSN
jgi:hypothetical protein